MKNKSTVNRSNFLLFLNKETARRRLLLVCVIVLIHILQRSLSNNDDTERVQHRRWCTELPHAQLNWDQHPAVSADAPAHATASAQQVQRQQ